MKIFDFLQDAIPELQSPEVVEFLSSADTNFVVLSNKLGLDPRTDFRNADLAGIDFSDCDLSDFVFHGADLSRSFGSNIVFPPVEALECADLMMSPFSFAIEGDQLIREATAQSSRLSLNDLDPTVTSEWVHKATRAASRLEDKALAKCLAILRKTSSPTIAIDVAHAVSNFYSGRRYRDFLFWVISQNGISRQVKFACFSILAKVFDRDRDVISYLTMILNESTDAETQFAAFKALLSRPSTRNNVSILHESLRGEGKENLRKQVIREIIGSRASRQFFFFFSGGFAAENLLIDYDKEVTSEFWERQCNFIARSDLVARLIGQGKSHKIASSIADGMRITKADLSLASSTLLNAFESLEVLGIKFKLPISQSSSRK